MKRHPLRFFASAFCLLILNACSVPPTGQAIDYSGPTADWQAYAAAPGGGRFSAATQITPENVGRLEQAWVYRTGDMRRAGEHPITYPNGKVMPGLASSWQLTPLLVNGRLYGCTAFNRVFALDAATGAELWSYDPGVDISREALVNCRGVSSWQDPQDAGGSCSHRIITSTMDSRLIALDGTTGKPCDDFGDGGVVNLRSGIGEHLAYEYSSLSPPAIIGDRVVVGTMVLDRVHNNMPSGVVRAFDVRSGALSWYWDPIPPGQEPVYDENGEPEFYRGTTNVWSIISVDEERDLVFLPTGNTSTDFSAGCATTSITGPVPWSPCAEAPGRWSGTSRWCTTTSGTTTRHRSPPCSTSNATVRLFRHWPSPPRWGTCIF